MTNRKTISLTDLQNTLAAKLPANKALFSEEVSKVSSERKIVSGIKGKRANKYKNVKVQDDGETYDSAKEAKRSKELRMMLKAGKIKWLAKQVLFSIHINGTHLSFYIADFLYQQGEEIICEDVKSVATKKLPVYRMKKKAMWLQHKIKIQEI